MRQTRGAAIQPGWEPSVPLCTRLHLHPHNSYEELEQWWIAGSSQAEDSSLVPEVQGVVGNSSVLALAGDE